MTPEQRRAAGNLLAGTVDHTSAGSELAARAAVQLVDGLGLTPEQTAELADRLAGVALVAGVVLRGLTVGGQWKLPMMLDMAADGLAAQDAEDAQGGPP